MTQDTTTALVTGANKGIGFEIAVGLGALGWRVGVGARDEGRREAAVARLREQGVDAFGVPLDVTDDDSVAAAARQLSESGGLDVLVNNAGVSGPMPQRPGATAVDTMREVVEVNVFGTVRVTDVMLPLLRESAHPRIVMMSSTVGSLTYQHDPDAVMKAGEPYMAYSPSKTYLNGVTAQYVRELADTPVVVNSACPGYVATDLNDFQGFRTPEQGAAMAVKLAQVPDDGPRGGFFDDEGTIPW